MTHRAATNSHLARSDDRSRPLVYPFAAIVGQEEMKLALLLNVIDPSIGGVLIMGHRGTGKSTAVRALADLLPPITKARGCHYGCDPLDHATLCADCAARFHAEGRLKSERARVPVVDLPLGATEDRVCGTINIERALTGGVKAFDPGLLARANRGFLYIDEVNLLEDHLVDLLLDVAVTGRNAVEREGISVEHPARFVLVGSGNPEEGELRPQLLDRFGLHVEVLTANDVDERVRIIIAREEFERDAASFRARFEAQQESLRRRLVRAGRRAPAMQVSRELLRRIAELCVRLKVDGHRGELTITRAARALAALEGRREVTLGDVRRVATMALRHRLRRDPLEQTDGGAQIEEALENLFPPEETPPKRARSKHQSDAEDTPPSGFAGDSSNAGGNNVGAGVSGQGERKGSRARAVAPALDAQLPEDALDVTLQAKPRTQARSARHQSRARRSVYNTRRGRYARAVVATSARGRVAIDATLRAAAGNAVREDARRPSPVDVSDLRFKLFKRKVGTLFIFAVDASGSMALNRIGQAKGALSHLLQQSYVRRDSVAIVSFRADRAEVLLPPCRSVARARRMLDGLVVGGSTPLSAALASSLLMAERASSEGARQVVLLLFTDGRANVSMSAGETSDKRTRQLLIDQELTRLGAALRRAGVVSVVVDTQNRFTSRGEAQTLAGRLGGRYVYFGTGPAAANAYLPALSLEARAPRRS
ncbi:MAG: magnesium chelatase ATPase subunit I [Pyrinomonadaceae bacterium]